MADRETIFLFTSEEERVTAGNWYACWINPESLNYPWDYISNQTMTTEGWVINHWQARLPTLSVSGKSGWILTPSLLDNLVGDLSAGIGKVIAGEKGIDGWKRVKKFGSDLFEQLKKGGQITDYDLSPRKFIDRLENVLKAPMYMEDGNGVEYYNVKYIHAYTKKYPNGVIFKGYATNFVINEQASDNQLISYSFNFVVEDIVDSTTNIMDFIKGVSKISTKVYEAGKKILGG